MRSLIVVIIATAARMIQEMMVTMMKKKMVMIVMRDEDDDEGADRDDCTDNGSYRSFSSGVVDVVLVVPAGFRVAGMNVVKPDLAAMVRAWVLGYDEGWGQTCCRCFVWSQHKFALRRP